MVSLGETEMNSKPHLSCWKWKRFGNMVERMHERENLGGREGYLRLDPHLYGHSHYNYSKQLPRDRALACSHLPPMTPRVSDDSIVGVEGVVSVDAADAAKVGGACRTRLRPRHRRMGQVRYSPNPVHQFWAPPTLNRTASLEGWT